MLERANTLQVAGLVVLAAGVVAGGVWGVQAARRHSEHLANVAKANKTVREIAECPESQLAAWLREVDPWGHAYEIAPDPQKPGERIVSSRGPDGEAGTDDDLTARRRIRAPAAPLR